LEKKVADELANAKAYTKDGNKHGENIWKCARYKPVEIALSLVPENTTIWVCVSSCPHGLEDQKAD